MTQLTNEAPDPEVLKILRERARPGDRWVCYRNMDFCSPSVGHLQFLQVGPTRTYTEPPARMPDTPQAIGWRYVRIGEVDMVTGFITEENHDGL